MIQCNITGTRYILKDSNICKKFDKFGKPLDEPIFMNELGNFRDYKAISFVNSNGFTNMGVFDIENTFRDVNYSAMMQVMKARGYIANLKTTGTQDGIPYTQVIFIYPNTYDLGGILNCI